MRNTYSASEIKKMLKLTTDALRFYEKKGLVHPEIKEDNHYRRYDFSNILELLDIIYYRQLNIPVSDIQAIMSEGDCKLTLDLIEQKQSEVKKQILYNQLLLKRLSYIKSNYYSVADGTSSCRIESFPESLILLESDGDRDFLFRRVRALTQDQFVLSSVYKKYRMKGYSLIEEKTFAAIERATFEDLHMDGQVKKYRVLKAQECIYTLLRRKEGSLSYRELTPLFRSLTFIPPNAQPMDYHEKVIYCRAGADEAPEAIRRNSLYYSIDHSGFFPEIAKDFVLTDELTAVDFGDLAIDKEQDVADTMKDVISQVELIYKNKAIPMVLGGDHLIPYPVVQALANTSDKKIGIIDFDSHLDMSWEPKYWAGSQWARIFETGIVKPENFVQIGIRGLRQSNQWRFAAEELGYKYFTMTEVEELGIKEVVRQAIEIAMDGTDGIYCPLDYDVLDAQAGPAQKYPDPCGLTSREIISALKMISQNPMKGFDICCESPKYDINGNGSQLAARCILEVMGGIGLQKKLKKDK